jgi:hypothetical protein
MDDGREAEGGRRRVAAAMTEDSPETLSPAGQAGTSARPADDLRSPTCPACGYDLTGLPDVGTCPECGSAYDRNDGLTLFGTAAGTLANITNQSNRDVAKLAGGWLLGLIVFGFFYRLNGVGSGFLGGLLLFHGLRLAFRAVTWGTAPSQGLVRVRLTGEGVRQEDTSPAAAAARRVAATCVAVGIAAAAGWLIVQVVSAGGWGDWSLPAMSVAVVAAFALALLLIRRTDLLTRVAIWIRFGPSVAGRGDRPHPWASVDEVTLGRSAAGRYRIRITRHGSWVFDKTLVDADVRLSDAQVGAVHEWIKICRRAVA